ncbi:MAG: hypothetical protein L0G87_12215 [Renibacterium salmoninarum]|nr:hypothetical protein [Renibacterium salmoninarum]
MKLDSFRVAAAELPMARPFSHAGAKRQTTASVLVFAEASGHTGWGEGAPRSYVTAETVESAQAAIEALDLDLLDRVLAVPDFAGAITALRELDLEAALGGPVPMPAAAAAVELALFDLICSIHRKTGFEALQSQESFASILRSEAVASPVSFVVDLSSGVAAKTSALSPEAIASVRHVKVKVSADLDDCVQRVLQVREVFGPDATVVLDANGAWTPELAHAAVRRLAGLSIGWIEEPVGPRDWPTMRSLREASGIPIMLDESFASRSDLEAAAAHGAADLVNIRISKCGGLLRSLSLLRVAHGLGLRAQLGVHVGEIGPLWGAMRLLAGSYAGLATVEAGKHDQWFPEPLTEPAIAVDRDRYLLPAPAGRSIGLGLRPSANLRRTLESSQETHREEREKVGTSR